MTELEAIIAALQQAATGLEGQLRGSAALGITKRVAANIIRSAIDRLSALRAASEQKAEPVATLHDDGCFTWKSRDYMREYRSSFAGWKMDVYAHPPAVEKKAEREWRPIETAPRDGTAILAEQWVYSDTHRVVAVMRWDGEDWVIATFHEGAFEFAMKPTHWMPLPDPHRAAAPLPPAAAPPAAHTEGKACS